MRSTFVAPEDSLGVFRPYALPLPTELLPLLLLAEEDRALLESGEFLALRGYEIVELPNLFVFSIWYTVSAFFKDYGYSNASAVPYQAIEQDDGSRGINEPMPTNVYGTPIPRGQNFRGGASRDGGARGGGRSAGGGPSAEDDAFDGARNRDSWGTFWAPWLGCRASWPVSQQCWFLCHGAYVAQSFAFLYVCVTLLLQLFILDAVVEANFLATAPQTTTWAEWAQSNSPWVPRITWMFGKFIIFTYILGISQNRTDPRSFLRSAQLRALLATMSNRYEGQTYSYCTVFIWAILVEMETVAVISYFPLVAAVIINTQSSGVSVNDAALILLLFQLIPELGNWGLGFLTFAVCFDTPSYKEVTLYVVGPRVIRLERVFSYVLFWWIAAWTTLVLVLIHYQYTILFIWTLPLTSLYLMVMWQSIPYCLDGWPQCWPHSGPCVLVAAICTTLVWIALVLVRYGCFLFPCLCAPDVPGWLFFQPTDRLRNPLVGAWDVRLPLLFLERVFGWPGLELEGGWDCAWEPLPSDFEEFHTSVGLLTGGEMAQMTQQRIQGEMRGLRHEVHQLERALASLIDTSAVAGRANG